jgi:hydroxymethylpyrimidine/phosphomethylpyrimidine kinase
MKPASVLAIGGLDPGGGAGLLADARAIQSAGAFASAAVSLVTVQSTAGVVAVRAVASSWVVRQADEVLRSQCVSVIKLGALGSTANVRAVADWIGKRAPAIPVILDPVMRPSRGPPLLLAARAVVAVRDHLLRSATLVTPNAPEAALLTSTRVTTLAEARAAARALVELGARAALVKGGHLEGGGDVIDVLAVGRRLVELRSKRLTLAPVHGGGCVLASLIAGRLAVVGGNTDTALIEVVRWARLRHQRALRTPRDVGGPARVLAP